MSFAPKDFYLLASVLHQEANNDSLESKRRTVISRSYYSAFLGARDCSPVNTRSDRVHQDVIDYYFSKSNKLVVANWLKTLRTMRNKADYDLTTPCTAKASGKSLKNASFVLKNLGLIP
jgi:uncharacterized protein (UPF0332 family)